MQQKHMDRTVARTGKLREGLTCEKISENGIPPFVWVLAASSASYGGMSYVSSKGPSHPSCGDPLAG